MKNHKIIDKVIVFSQKVYDSVLYLTKRAFMESIINKLTEIRSAASAIAEHAELQKSSWMKYEEKRKQFDLDLEQETQAHLQNREALEADTQTLLDQQAESNDSCVLALKKEYESRHTL